MDLSHWMTSTIVARKLSGTDGRNRPVYEAARTIKAAVEPFFDRIEGPDGIERRAQTRVATHTQLNAEDHVWIVSDGANADDLTAGLRPLAVRIASLPTGARLFEVYL